MNYPRMKDIIMKHHELIDRLRFHAPVDEYERLQFFSGVHSTLLSCVEKSEIDQIIFASTSKRNDYIEIVLDFDDLSDLLQSDFDDLRSLSAK